MKYGLGLDDIFVFDWMPSFASLKMFVDVAIVSFFHGFHFILFGRGLTPSYILI